MPTADDMLAMSIGIYNLILKDLLSLAAEIFDARRPEHTHEAGSSCLVDELSDAGECWIYGIMLTRMTRFASEIDASIAPDNTLFQWLRGDTPNAYEDGIAHLDETALLPEPEFTAVQQYAIHYGMAHLLETESADFVKFVEAKSPKELDEYVERPEVVLYMRTMQAEILDIMPKVEIARTAWRLSEESTTILAPARGSDD
jgi:hypothetical protein